MVSIGWQSVSWGVANPREWKECPDSCVDSSGSNCSRSLHVPYVDKRVRVIGTPVGLLIC